MEQIELEAVIVFVPAEKYKKALDQISHGEYVKSYEQLISLDDYKDSKQKAKEIYDQYHVQKLENLPDVPVGDSILFGAYEQDNDTSDGKEKIEWIILKKEKDRAFLLSEEEAEECLPTSQEKQAEPTEYALAQGVSAVERTTDFDYGYCSWWLRSPGFLQKNANYVSESGVTSFYGAAVDNLDFGVRPAMWINITAS